MDVVIIGAGISGLAAARRLRELGHAVRVIDKGRGVGGRMATRRLGGALDSARLDHGAQFFTTRSDAFVDLVGRAEAAGAVTKWTDGFGAEPDGHPRWRGTDGMTSLCKWMAADADLDVALGETVVDLAEHPADAHILTAPVPQALAILSFSRRLPEPALADRLAALRYVPTIAVMLAIDDVPPAMPAHGGVQLVDHPDLAFVADNQAKGISVHPAITIHLSNARSAAMWEASDDEVVAFALAATAEWLGEVAVVERSIQRWRYAGPVETHPEPTVVWGASPITALAGEMFAGPKVEGAFLSGLAAADAVHDRSR